MQSVMIAIQILVSIAMIAVILLQRSEGGALGMGGSGSGLGGLFSPRGAADTLTRTTTVLAVLFFLSSLGLTLLSLHGRNESPLPEQPSAPAKSFSFPLPATHPAQPQVPSVPKPH